MNATRIYRRPNTVSESNWHLIAARLTQRAAYNGDEHFEADAEGYLVLHTPTKRVSVHRQQHLVAMINGAIMMLDEIEQPPASQTIEIRGTQFKSASEAIAWANANGGTVIRVGGKTMVVADAESTRLAEAGIEFAEVYTHQMPDGTHRIISVPVN